MEERKLLSEFTTEELRKELRRRRKKPAPVSPKWLEWRGEVTEIHEWGKYKQYTYTVKTEDPRVPDKEKTQTYPIKRGCIKKEFRPKVGDTVLLSLRYTKKMKEGKQPIWWGLGKIKEIIKNKED